MQLIAWTVAVLIHAVLLWLLLSLPGVRVPRIDPVRTRLVMVAPSPAPVPSPPPVGRSDAASPTRPNAVPTTPAPSRPKIRVVGAQPPALADPPQDWQQQARDWAQRELPAEQPAFASDPLRSRRAQLPGGERGQRFRMSKPLSVADVARGIGQLFGAGEDPCRTVRDSIPGLLTATSERERELLQEQLRQQRDYCSP